MTSVPGDVSRPKGRRILKAPACSKPVLPLNVAIGGRAAAVGAALNRSAGLMQWNVVVSSKTQPG